MNQQNSKAEIFDVFLCHNSEDKPAIREIAQKLKKEGIKPWLDEDQIRPGTTWQKALGEQIENIKSAAVFVGKNGIGPWQDEEIQAFLGEFMRRKCPVIPTVLADAPKTPELPWTLRNRHWVDFRVSEPDPLRQLIWGITGVKSTAAASLIPGREDNAAPRARFSESRYCPPLAQAPDQEQTLQKEIRVTGAGFSKSFASLSIKNPIKDSIRILSVKIRIGKTKVVCTCIQKENSKPDERLGTSPICLDGHSTGEWEIPYQVIGAGKEPEEIIIEYETLRGSAKEKTQDPSLLRLATKEVKVPDSAKNCIMTDFEGSQSFDDKENFPAAMGLARKSFFKSTTFCETLRGTGVAIVNETSRSIDIESVWFVKENHRTLAYLNNEYIQKRLVSAKTLRNQERDIWIIPKELDPLWQGRRHVEITYRMSIGEESFVDTIEKLL